MILYFQSPFYRVFECNFRPYYGENAKGFYTFSPLSIGSLSVTLGTGFEQRRLVCSLSVPFLSGL